MSGIKQQNPKFITSNIFSRMLIPFSAVMYTTLKEVILSPQAGGMVQSWLSMGFSLAFFYMLQVTTLKWSGHRFLRKDLWTLGFAWLMLAIVTQLVLFVGIYHVPLPSILNSYNFLKLEPWPYSLVALFLAPRLCAIPARSWPL